MLRVRPLFVADHAEEVPDEIPRQPRVAARRYRADRIESHVLGGRGGGGVLH